MLGKAFGLTGAKISIIILIFIFVMLVTRSKMDFVYNAFVWAKEGAGKLFDGAKNSASEYRRNHKEQREIERQQELERRIARQKAAEEAARKAEEEKAERREFFGFDTEDREERSNEGKKAGAARAKSFVSVANGRKGEIDIPVDDDEPHSSFTESESMRNNENYLRLKEALGIEDYEPADDEIYYEAVLASAPTDDIVENEEFFEEERAEESFSTVEPLDEEEIIPPEDAPREENADFYRFPPISLLTKPTGGASSGVTPEIQANGERLVETLKSFGVSTKILDISRGPAVTRYELQPSAGVKISKITGLADDIALNLAANGVRIEAPIPGKPAVGIEIPNKEVNVVRMREIIDTNEFNVSRSKLTVALGRDIGGQAAFGDLAKMPHLLIAGSTGSGKSVCINSIIVSLLYKASPDEVKLLMVDPKVVELGIYNGIPHLLVPVVTDAKKAAGALAWAVTEMLKRYNTFADNNVRDIFGYNELADMTEGMKRMEQVVIIIDELADLMMVAPHEVEESIFRLAQMARAAGMYLIIATQRPSVDVITGVIKANIPSRIAFAVSSQVDSRTIIDMGGAEKLLGRGDMLFLPMGESKPKRIQGCFVSDKEIEKVVEFVKQGNTTEYNEEVSSEIDRQAELTVKAKGKNNGGGDGEPGGEMDDVLMQAIEFVVDAGQASTSMLQRRLRVGYARAGRLIDEMEQMGIVGPHEGSKPRTVLMNKNQFMEMKMRMSGEQE